MRAATNMKGADDDDVLVSPGTIPLALWSLVPQTSIHLHEQGDPHLPS